MVISRTPFRISFFGGGTDFPEWYQTNGGVVLSTTIDKFCYISLRHLPPFFEHKHRIVYSLVENVKEISEIKHPVVRAVLKYFNVQYGVEIHHDADLPARSGIGSSSAFTVGMLNAMYALMGKIVSKELLAKEAIYVERVLLNEAVGCQDQIAVAYGGLNKIIFYKDNDFLVQPITLTKERVSLLQEHLMLVFTGICRYSSSVAKTQIKNIKKKEKELTYIKEAVDEAIDILNSSSDILKFGKLMHKTWLLKKSLSSSISNTTIDAMYNTARRYGAVGGKILGAGGGGFMLFFVPPEKKEKILEKLKYPLEVKFNFEREGSQIIYYNP